jgi:hypothetical protein
MGRPPNRKYALADDPDPEEPDVTEGEYEEEDELPRPLRAHERRRAQRLSPEERDSVMRSLARRLDRMEQAQQEQTEVLQLLGEEILNQRSNQAIVPVQPEYPISPPPRRSLSSSSYAALESFSRAERQSGRFVNPGGFIVLALSKHRGKTVKVYRDDLWQQEVAAEPIVPRQYEGIDTYSALVTGLRPGRYWVLVDWIWMIPRRIYIDGDSVQVIDVR